jgi:hypothetical protein
MCVPDPLFKPTVGADKLLVNGARIPEHIESWEFDKKAP